MWLFAVGTSKENQKALFILSDIVHVKSLSPLFQTASIIPFLNSPIFT